MKLLRLLVALLAAVVVTGSLGPAAPSANASAVGLPDQARLSFTVTTTSDWTGVYLFGTVAAHQVVSVDPPGATVSVRDNGFVVNDIPAGGTTVVVEAAFEAPAGVDAVAFVTQKGYVGTAALTVTNLTRPRPVLDEINAVRSSTDARNTALWVRPRIDVFGAAPSRLPKVSDTPLVLAYYYPWFGRSSYASPELGDTPLHPYDAWDSDDVRDQVRQAREHGIDGFVVAWQGEAKNGAAFDNVVAAAQEQRTKATVLIETATANESLDVGQPASRAVVTAWLSQALDRAGSGAFLEHGGVPVVFVFDMGRLPAREWTGILADLAARGQPVLLVGDTNTKAYRSVSLGYHRYDVNLDGETPVTPAALAAWNRRSALTVRGAAPPRLFAATVSPGFDKRSYHGDVLPVIDRGTDGRRYRDTWEAAHAVDPDWVMVTSWNEWYETTNVQPGTRFGSRALEQTAFNSWRFKRP